VESRNSDETPGRRLGRKLREARVTAGYRSQQSLGDIIKMHRTTVGKIESGERQISAKLLKLWCETCNVDFELFEPSARIAWASQVVPVPVWFEDFKQAQGFARMIRTFHPVIVPGLLQTEEYTTILHEEAGLTQSLISERVASRMDLQLQVLDRDPPVQVIAIIDEVVLRRQVGSREVMARQCRRLVELGKRRSVTIRVIPNLNGGNAGHMGPFTIASLEDGDVMLKGAMGEDITTDKPSDIRAAMDVFERVGWVALSASESLDLIAKMGDEWAP
jgi:transcriptional regulator with XRE-family HTH domain